VAYDRSIALKRKWGGDAMDVELTRAMYEDLGYIIWIAMAHCICGRSTNIEPGIRTALLHPGFIP